MHYAGPNVALPQGSCASRGAQLRHAGPNVALPRGSRAARGARLRHAGLPLRCRRVAGPKSAKSAKSDLAATKRLRPGPKRDQKWSQKWTKSGAKRGPGIVPEMVPNREPLGARPGRLSTA